MAPSLWKYYTKEQTQDFLLSLHLTENLTHTPTAEMALLYALPITQTNTTKKSPSLKETALKEFFMRRTVY